MPEKMMYEAIIDLVGEGNCTDEMLCKFAGVESTRSLTKYWNQIETRNLFHAKDGDYHLLLSAEDAAATKSGSGSPTKTTAKKWTEDPQAKRAMFDSRLTTKIGKAGTAKSKLEGNENDPILKLRVTIANCEYHVANIQRANFRSIICAELGITDAELDACPELNEFQATKRAEVEVVAETEAVAETEEA